MEFEWLKRRIGKREATFGDEHAWREDIWWEEDPTFGASDYSVPCRGCIRVFAALSISTSLSSTNETTYCHEDPALDGPAIYVQ
jgi:hypothetical protein